MVKNRRNRRGGGGDGGGLRRRKERGQKEQAVTSFLNGLLDNFNLQNCNLQSPAFNSRARIPNSFQLPTVSTTIAYGDDCNTTLHCEEKRKIRW